MKANILFSLLFCFLSLVNTSYGQQETFKITDTAVAIALSDQDIFVSEESGVYNFIFYGEDTTNITNWEIYDVECAFNSSEFVLFNKRGQVCVIKFEPDQIKVYGFTEGHLRHLSAYKRKTTGDNYPPGNW